LHATQEDILVTDIVQGRERLAASLAQQLSKLAQTALLLS
jgi:hypothetical protein